MKNQYLLPLFSKLDEQADIVIAEFSNLSADQLNWKPQSDKWSIAQCLDHLMTMDGLYFQSFEQLLEGTYRKNIWERLPMWSDMMGKMLVNGVQPDGKAMRGPASFAPSESDLAVTIVADFEAHLENIKDWMQRLDRFDHQKTTLKSPALGILTMKLEHAITAIVVHTERHIQQAQRVLKQQ